MHTKIASCRSFRSICAVAALALELTACSAGGGGGAGSGSQGAAKAITTFSLSGMAGIIDETSKTIMITMPPGAAVNALVPTFTATGTSVTVGASTQSSGVTANDFSNPVVYTVTASDGTTADYTVSVTAISTSGVVSQLKSINTSSQASHVLVIKNDNTVWAWGRSDACQLGTQVSCATNGLGSVIIKYMATPTQVAMLGTNFTYATAGFSQSFAYGSGMYTQAWGANNYGVLGDGTTTFRSNPISTLGSVRSLASNSLFTAAVKTDGTLWGWGSMVYSSPLLPYSPNQIGAGFEAVTAGSYYAIALKSDGTVWTWGYSNANGELGRTVLYDVNGISDAKTPVQILTGATRIWAGGATGYAIKSDGTLWAWGSNSLGQYGNGSTTNSVTPIQIQSGFATIAAGNSHVAALKSDGSLWTWGSNSYGQLADGTTTDSLVPKKVGSGYTMVAAGSSTTFVANAVGEIFGAGRNYLGELGNGAQVMNTTSLTKSLPLVSSASGTGGVGTAVGGYQCPTSKPAFDPLWIQSHGSYWAAASAHDSYTTCLESNSEPTCHSYYTLEKQYCDYALPACLAVATAADCPG